MRTLVDGRRRAGDPARPAGAGRRRGRRRAGDAAQPAGDGRVGALVVIDGEGFYRDADGRDERIGAGLPHAGAARLPAHLRHRSRPPVDRAVRRLHRPGVRLAGRARRPRAAGPALPATRAARRGAARRAAHAAGLARGPPSTSCWRSPTGCSTPQDPATEPAGLDLSPEVASAVDRLGDDQTAQLDLHAARRRRRPLLRHVPAPVHRAGRPVAVGVPHLAAGCRPPPPCSGSPT